MCCLGETVGLGVVVYFLCGVGRVRVGWNDFVIVSSDGVGDGFDLW